MVQDSARFQFQVVATKGRARAGVMTTPHGQVQTPVFMPVGTRASVKALDSADLVTLQAQIILANTYHVYLRPGSERVAQAGGLQQFTRWQRPMLTDSGGFQVFSLGVQQKEKGRTAQTVISEQEVQFKSHLDGSLHHIGPESAIAIQSQLGADIIMAFDECVADDAPPDYLAASVARTSRWARRCHQAWEARQCLSTQGKYQALFGIVQGGTDLHLRRQSLSDLLDIGFDGYALGGETVGYNRQGTQAVMAELESAFPAHQPRYAMGMGRDPEDIVVAVLMGFDMFDCVGPTRLARNGALYHGQLDFAGENPRFVSDYSNGRLPITNARFATDDSVIQADCDCATCQYGYSRAYLHHLSKSSELSYYRLATVHNIRFMVRLAQQLREWLIR